MAERSIVTDLIILVVGVIIGHVWNRIVNRLSVLRFEVWHNYIGLSTEDPRFGSVQISYNGAPVKSLYLSTAVITNDSNRDLSNLELNVTCDQASTIIISYATNKSGLDHLNFTNKFSKMLDESKTETASLVGGRRDYVVPVLNRGDAVEVAMLITNINAVQPVINVVCLHAGVIVRFQKAPPQRFYGESQRISVLVGILICIFLCYLIIDNGLPLNQAVWFSFALGATVMLFGFLAIKLFKFLRRFLS